MKNATVAVIVCLCLVVLCFLVCLCRCRSIVRHNHLPSVEASVENYTAQHVTSIGTLAVLRYEGPDMRLRGRYARLQGLRFKRNYATPNGKWAHEVWVRNGDVAIYDHQVNEAMKMHIWSVGPWSLDKGGAQNTRRYAYIYTYDRDGTATDSKELLAKAWICNGWVGTKHGYKANGGCAGTLTLQTSDQTAADLEVYRVPRFPSRSLTDTTYSTGEPETLRYLGSDPRIPGHFTRLDGVRLRRKQTASDGQWAKEVWFGYTRGVHQGVDMVAIYDHQVNSHGTHIWSIGPWSPDEYGPRGGDGWRRYGYAYVNQTAINDMKQAIGLQRDIESKDALTIANICNGWDANPKYRGCNGAFFGWIHTKASKDRERNITHFKLDIGWNG